MLSINQRLIIPLQENFPGKKRWWLTIKEEENKEKRTKTIGVEERKN